MDWKSDFRIYFEITVLTISYAEASFMIVASIVKLISIAFNLEFSWWIAAEVWVIAVPIGAMIWSDIQESKRR